MPSARFPNMNMMMKVKVNNASPGVLAALALVACGSSEDALEDAPAALATYADVLHAGYDDSALSASALRDALMPLSSGAATDAALAMARTRWVLARVPYQQTEIARFYDGPIDDPERGNLEALINAWPLDEATIDYVRGADGMPIDGGIINSPEDVPDITAELLAQRNMMPGEENVTTGYHAIEFLLWGQDFDADGPGDRPYTDYVDGIAANADRRGAYLDVASQLLVDDLTQIRDAWAPGDDTNYRARFLASDPREALRRVLVGMGTLAGPELAGQRIRVAYTTKDQNDEHSCFSDTTNADLENDVLGISNLYHGHYTRTDGTEVDGPSLSDLVRARDPELDARVSAEIQKALDDVRAWPEVAGCPSATLEGSCPFDALILGTDDAPGRQALDAVYLDLGAVTTSVQDIAALFGIDLRIDDSGE